MKKNMNRTDGLIRAGIAAVLGLLVFLDVINGMLAIIGLVVAVIFLATSFIHVCPIYMLFGASTCKTDIPAAAKTEEDGQ